MTSTAPIIVVIADGIIDIIEEKSAHLKGHIKDLREMGFEVKTRSFNNWQDAYRFEEGFDQ